MFSSTDPRDTRAPRRRRSPFRDEGGFTLIEVTGAMVILAILATALAGLLQSAIAANGLARQKTVAQQLAQDQIEWIRNLDYTTEVGIPSGNPTGIIPATRAIDVRGTEATMTTAVAWVNDPTPASYSSVANYKRVTVTIRSDRNGAVLTSAVTYVSPPGRAPFGGLNNAIINVKVQDMGLAENDLVQGAVVQLANGPSSPLSDTTDANGLVTFPQLVANPTSGADAYYDISVSKSGYTTYFEDVPPGAAAHVQVAPSQTLGPQVIRIYKPATLDVELTSGGTPYAQPATVKVTSQRLGVTKTFSTSTGSLEITTFDGQPVVPGDFTVRAFTPSGLCADPVLQYVPDDYPTTLSTTFALALQTCPDPGNIAVTVTQLGMPANGATVQVEGGPNDMTPLTGTTAAAGTITFSTLPSGSDSYTVTATKGAQSANTTAVVGAGATVPVSIALPDPPMGNRTVNVQWAGSPVNGATVVLSGGPFGVTQTLTTTSSGSVTFTAPLGSGYTITASKSGQSASASSVTVTSSGTTTLNLPTATLTVTATWAGQSIGSGTNNVTVTGGPNGGTYTGSTNSSGVATITVPVGTTAYSVSVTKGTGSGSGTVVVPSGGASLAVAFTQVGTIRVTTTWGGSASSGAAISITGGPLSGTYTGTTNGSGIADVVVPTGTSYSVTATKSGVTATGTVATVTTGGTSTLTLSFTRTFTINVKRSSTNQNNAIVRIVGGPTSTTITGTFVSNGNYTMSNVPIGSGYTIRAYANPCTAVSNPKSKTSTGVTVTATQGTVNVVYDANTCPLP